MGQCVRGKKLKKGKNMEENKDLKAEPEKTQSEPQKEPEKPAEMAERGPEPTEPVPSKLRQAITNLLKVAKEENAPEGIVQRCEKWLKKLEV